MSETFPAVGHCYLVDFKGDSGEFRVKLDFHSATSLTYTGVKPDGSLDTANQETVTITVEPLRDQLFLVTWQEKEGDTVVHIEDYKNNTIITNITDPGSNPTHPVFSRFHGTMKQIA
jgi:hypothetical protein